MGSLFWKCAGRSKGIVALALFVLSASTACERSSKTANVGSEPKAATDQNSLPASGDWTFAVGGDSRNCGDVIMPAIAKSAKENNSRFYWHLGDFRWIVGIDEDEMGRRQNPVDELDNYWDTAWDDFKTNQIQPFHSLQIDAYVGIGNHETYYPVKLRSIFGKPISRISPRADRNDFLAKFSDLIPKSPEGSASDKKAYYHWTNGGIDFVYLDNADETKFDEPQLDWLNQVLQRDEAPGIHAVVVAMHAALPHSIASDHAMDETPGCESGEKAYEQLAQFWKKTKKPVYLLASHAHYFAKDLYNTSTWQHSAYGVLPGWIIGTAGAERKQLPAGVKDDDIQGSSHYGYLLAKVHSAGPDTSIAFEFRPITEVPAPYKDNFTLGLVDWCFKENTSYRWSLFKPVPLWYRSIYAYSKRRTFQSKPKTLTNQNCKVQDATAKPLTKGDKRTDY
jgi:hypothetical protein